MAARLQPKRNSRHRWRNLRASWRDSIILFREFAWPLLFFTLAIIIGGVLYYRLSRLAGEPTGSLVESIYLILALTFLQPIGEFPDHWYLQIFYFIMPIIGIGILARGLADFGHLFFNRHARGKEWEMAVASTFQDHVVLIGLGHLGFRVARELHELGQDMVVIEQNPQADLITAAHEMNIPVIEDDGKRKQALQNAGISKARALVVCTQNDNLNMQIAFRARKLNPALQIVLRIFDDEFANAVEEQFGFRALSATRMAAPNFATAVAGVDITRPITVEGEPFSLACFSINRTSPLAGKKVAEIEQIYNVSVVLLRQNGASDYHPAGDRQLAPEDLLAIFAGPDQISRLVDDNVK